MIPTIDAIVAGLVHGTISPEQATAWLHQHAAIPDEDRMMLAGMAMQGFLSAPLGSSVGDQARGNPSYAAEWAVDHADTLYAMLRATSLSQGLKP